MNTSVKILSTITPPLRWVPEQKEFTTDFLRAKSKDPNGPRYEDLSEGANSVLQEAQRILGRCLPPFEPAGQETGLVVGYVQSGKTMSFETVIALARDNGYGLVIVLAGTKNNLRDQSEYRLRKDLGIEDGGDDWFHVSNPTKAAQNHIEGKISAWTKKSTKKSLLITVLKHGGHLEKLAEVLKKIDLTMTPSLIIDDESDQASLNTKAAKNRKTSSSDEEKSATYEKILNLRQTLPHHSYLQYTATPQANLLLAQTDLLNASFAEIVTPGDAYTGGKSFFLDNNNLIVQIPPEEVPTKDNILNGPPKSLLKSIRFFLLVAAHHSLTREKGMSGKDRNRSMMVHPAVKTSSHKEYKDWVDKAKASIANFVESQHLKKPDVVLKLFSEEYNSLASTEPQLKPLPDLISAMIDDVFDELLVVEVNGTPDAEKNISWKQTRYWILVGGAKLDRGYTVEGLCITYMPRPLGGVPAADTLQQRARFFGYKKSYLGLCRVFVQPSVQHAFTEYVEHEEFVRSALAEHRGKSLTEWRRDFVLTELLKPTRPNVIGLGTRRIPADGWLVPDVLQRDFDAQHKNRILLNDLMITWQERFGPASNAGNLAKFSSLSSPSPHEVFDGIPLHVVLEEFLLKILVRDPRDAEEHSAMILALTSLLRKDDSLVTDVYLMNKLQTGYRTRNPGRGLPASHHYAPINQYFSQSADTFNDKDYCSGERITLQIRKFNLGTTPRDRASADIFDVVWFALNIPKKLKKTLMIEERS
ncbi:Z1 domain-containing protein [Pseudomonas sichuanensis]|uniref:Z1 domain-containing protein n=1 Tax=Pseudomonas sichuanensis TaxID=2213015 RepID=UPI00381E8094